MTRTPTRALRLLAATLVTGALLAGCGSDSDPGTESGPGTTTTAAATTTVDDTPAPEVPVTPADAEGCRTPEDLQALTELPAVEVPEDLGAAEHAVDEVPGCGDLVEADSSLSLRYVLYVEGAEEPLESTWEAGTEAGLQLGQGQVLKGLEVGLVGMRAGGRRLVTLPAEGSYGTTGAGEALAGKAALFVVDLVAVIPPPEVPETPADAEGCRTPEEAAEQSEAPSYELPEDPAAAPFAADVIPGCGDLVESGDTLRIHYELISLEDGEERDASWGRGEPFEVVIGTGQVIDGWDLGLIGMRAGGRRTLVLPPEYGYGPEGSGHELAGKTLHFVVDLLEVG